MKVEEETKEVEAPTGNRTQHLIHLACQYPEVLARMPVMGFCGTVYTHTPANTLKCPICMEVEDPEIVVTCPKCGMEVHFAGGS